MTRDSFEKGVRFLLDEQLYIVLELLTDNRIRVENKTFGGEHIYNRADLVAAWGKFTLEFEVHGPNTHATGDRPILTEYTIADFQQVEQKYRTEAWRRYNLILPLLALVESRNCRMLPRKDIEVY